MANKLLEKKLVVLRARHFKDSLRFTDTQNCPMARAVREAFNTQGSVSEAVSMVRVHNDEWIHRSYREIEYRRDKNIARRRKFNNSVIKSIYLKRYL